MSRGSLQYLRILTKKGVKGYRYAELAEPAEPLKRYHIGRKIVNQKFIFKVRKKIYASEFGAPRAKVQQ